MAMFTERLEAFRLGLQAATGGLDAVEVGIDPETLEELRQLGYIK